MALRGGYSFVAMLVINPVIILFYQNCSMAPVSYASKQDMAPPPAISRSVASEASEVTPSKCDPAREKCIHSTIE